MEFANLSTFADDDAGSSLVNEDLRLTNIQHFYSFPGFTIIDTSAWYFIRYFYGMVNFLFIKIMLEKNALNSSLFICKILGCI